MKDCRIVSVGGGIMLFRMNVSGFLSTPRDRLWYYITRTKSGTWLGLCAALFPYRSGVDGRLHISGTVLCRVRADMLDILQQLSLSDLAAKLHTNSLRAAYLHRPVACTYRTRDAPDVLSSSRFSSKAIPEASRIKNRRSVIPRPEFAGVMLRNRRSEIPPTTNTTSVCTRYRRVLPENLSYLRQILRPASTMRCSV